MLRRMFVLALLGLIFGPMVTAEACFVRSPQPVQVWLDQVAIDLRGNVAEKHYICAFKNPNGGAIVGGECYMELEPGAHVDGLTVSVDGRSSTAEVLPVEEANKVFTTMVKEGGSPALLEYFGNQLIRTKLPNVPAGETVTVELRYTTVMKKQGDFLRIRTLNTNPKVLRQRLKAASVKVRIQSDDPLKTIYSPTHEIKIGEEEGWDAVVSWEEENYLPKKPFVLYVGSATDPVSAGVLTYREPGKDGTFMLILSPGHGTPSASDGFLAGIPKDVVFCVDTSGSMLQDDKIDQMKAALKYCVNELREGDRFNIVSFNTKVETYAPLIEGLVEVTSEVKADATDFVRTLHARGGTAIAESLTQSIHLLKSSTNGDEAPRARIILFATDGMPTVGERDSQKILDAVQAANGEQIRLFIFGEGYGVNAKLLDRLALENRGEADYVLPKEDISEKIESFFERIGTPLMTDLTIEIPGLESYDVYPETIPDLYRGEQLIVFGRYSGSGTKTVVLRGNSAEGERVMEYVVDFPSKDTTDTSAFVPRLWAGRRVDDLLMKLRGLDEPDAGIIEEIVGLATRYGIVTPYTSFLLDEGLPVDASEAVGIGGGATGPPRKPALLLRSRLEEESKDRDDAKTTFDSSRELAQARKNAAKSGNATDFYRQAQEQLDGLGVKRDALDAVQYVDERTFYHRNGRWEQAEFQIAGEREKATAKEPIVVPIGSKAYFDLLSEDPRAAKFLSLGNVILELNNKWYAVQ
ncbi:VIT and vWA domain-containing protein [Calycomorphotria hydatis]|uniref:von Willebrand factor type A domain protein n=1 Tax=Calycomorphotria hydatis TaxID=2528027 RepID=A0A517T5U4_9PLAN|nr:VIT and VWA domain-containing protein [Calycomorphotria hydatis]QDT63752.1 von Willebrand factor type A domain protein [Calycomorphotria hydatis]